MIRNTSPIRRRALLTMATVVLCVSPAIASPRLEELLEEGKTALDAGRYEAARSAFDGGRRRAAASDDLRWQARFNFYLGLNEQTEGRRLAGEGSIPHLERAARHYRQVLELQPESTVTAGNLAMVYFQLAAEYQAKGDVENANICFAQARQLADTEQQIQFAQRLEELDLWRRAADFWEEIVKQNPRSIEPHRKMMDLYLERQADDVVPYLWEILEAGQPLRAVDGALEALLAGGWDRKTKIELLTVIASGLARRVDEPRDFPDTYFGQELQELESDPDVGRACRELRSIHVADPPAADDFPWWRRQLTSTSADPPHGAVWPLDAFRQLVRSLGRWFRSRGDLATAEDYYRLALDLDRDSVDLEAFNSLVWLTLEAADDRESARRQLETLNEEYSPDLFTAKAGAYRRSEQERIFEFHRTLGGLYGALGEWGDRSTPASAIFQLEYARKTAELLDRDPSAQTLHFTPEMANMLAVAYERIGANVKSQEVRSEAAATYRRQGDDEAADKVLRLNDKSLPQAALRSEKAPRSDDAGAAYTTPFGRWTYDKQTLDPKQPPEIEKLDPETLRKLQRETLRGKDQDG